MLSVHQISGLLGVAGFFVAQYLGLDVPAETLGFVFFGFGGSDSRTESNTSNTQNIRNLNLSDLEGTTIADSEDIEITTNIEQIDAGLIDAARDISRDAFDISRSVADDANALAAQAIKANESALNDVLGFSGDALRETARGIGDANLASLDFGRDVFDSSLDALRAGQSEAFSFGGDVVGEFSALNRQSVETIADVAREASRNVSDIALASQDNAFGFASEANRTIADFASGSQASAFDFVGDLFSGALNAVTETSRKATDTLSSAIGQAAAATRSDATDVLNNIVKYGAIALGVAAVAYAISRSAK